MTDPLTRNMADPPADPAAAASTGGPAAAAGRPAQPGWLEALQAIGRELPGLVSDRIDLLSLELQRAGQALAQIVALLVAVAILGVTGWLALWAGIAVGLVELGLHWSLALLLVLAMNAGAAWLVVARLRLLLPLLRLPATRRHLTLGRTSEPAEPPAPSPTRADTTAAPPLGQAG